MGCICSSAQNEDSIQLDINRSNIKEGSKDVSININEPIKESLNKFESNFKEKIEEYGNIISKNEFETILPNEIQTHMNENPFKINSDHLSSSHNYNMEPIEFKNGNIYQGHWNKDLKMDGPGKYYLKDDKVFVEGNWEKGELKFGRVFLQNGDIYEGEIKNSEFNGKGKLKSNDNTYEGNFENGEKTGKGKIIFNDGTIYEGDVEKGEMKGNGHMTWKNGYEYEGDFNGSILTGKGKLSCQDGDIYDGDFENNLFHGKGKYIFKKSGNTYEGDFQYGVKKGKGIYTCKDQYIYDGYWDNDLPCGFGKVTNLENNSTFKCTWRYGKMVEEPIFETGNEEDFNTKDFQIKPNEMTLDTKKLPHLENLESDSTQYKLGKSLSFLNE